jgi:uncharacterized protein
MVPLDALIERVRPLYEEKDPGHRFDHIQRIMSFCNTVGEELGADLDLLLRAAVIHGVKDKSQLVETLGDDFDRIVGIAEYHSGEPELLEEKILWDANIIDSLGAIGLTRSFIFVGYNDQGLEETIRIIRKNMLRPLYTEPGKRRSIRLLEEMNEFLIKLENQMAKSQT